MALTDITKVARNEFITDVVDSIQKEIGLQNVDINNIDSNLMIIASAEACTEWEEWFGLSYEPNWTLEDRRNRLVYTLNSKGFFTKKFLTEQAKIFTNGEIEVIEQFEDYHFVVKFTSLIGVPPSLDNFRSMVNVNKPAHLTWELEFRYRIWDELKTRTWDSLKDYTWLQVREQTILSEEVK